MTSGRILGLATLLFILSVFLFLLGLYWIASAVCLLVMVLAISSEFLR